MKTKFLTKTIFLLVLLISINCSSLFVPKPDSSISEVEFNVYPHILEKDSAYYLRYQIKTSGQAQPPLLRVVYAREKRDRAYYFFSTPISHPERGEVVERNIADDGFTEFAKTESIYWLNKDRSEEKLKIVKE